MSADTIVWTDERIDQLKTLWAEGHSASVIACRLPGGFSRNAILGKAHRMGLPTRGTTSRKAPASPKADRRERAAQRVVLKAKQATKPVIQPQPRRACKPVREVAANPQTILTIGNGQCRWPIDESHGQEMLMCGAPVACNDGVSKNYCAAHAKRAVQTPPKRKRHQPSPDYVPAGNRRFNFRGEFA